MNHILSAEEKARIGKTPKPMISAPSPIHLIDPRIRIVATCIFAIAVVSLHDFQALGIALSFSLLIMITARMPLGRTLRRMAMMDSFIIFMLALLPFTTPGQTAFTLFGLPASWEGIFKACEIGLKANAIILALMALVGTMESVTLGHALSHLRVPVTLVHLMLFTVRYIEVLNEEYQRLRTAMKARGFRPANSMHTYRSVGYLVGMLLVRSLERSERILQAMKCRGFNGRLHLLDDMRYTRFDLVFGVIFGWLLALIFFVETTNVGTV